MSNKFCRVCGSAFFKKPLLQYSDMPKAAQNFPDADALAEEKGSDLTVCQCSGCGLVQLNNEPVSYYREVIRAAAVSQVVKDAKTAQFASFIERHSLKGRKVVEIGCGRGEFLSLLAPLGVDAYGLEYGKASAEHCMKSGLKVSRGYADGFSKLPHAPFDAFLLLMFLEHMPEPNSALQNIRDNLSEGAVGIVEAPNFDMMLRSKLFSEFIGDHLLYFSRDTLLAALGLNGFEVLDCRELRDSYVLSAEVRKRSPLDISSFHSYQEKISAEIAAYFDKFGEKRVAVWGAGHQALAIIALAGIADRIRYVVDSAPFKQGKFTPATHIPVLAPDSLRSDPVDAVIVMAASYSDEIAGILRRDFDPALQVAILRESGLEIIA